VPLSRRRMLERGHNQAETIAVTIGRCLKLPVDIHTLTRTINTQIHRVGMDRRARELTVGRAFKVNRPNLVAGKRILLIDDVMTSGATGSACSYALKKAGAETVHLLTLARAVYH
jgi:ComF family protein